MNNGFIRIDIVSPNGKEISQRVEIGMREFHEYLKPIHINENPFKEDDHEKIESIKKSRDMFVNHISGILIDSFEEFFKRNDTVNGYKEQP